MVRRLTKGERNALREVGTPEETHNRIMAYTRAVTRLADRQQELVKQYPKEWVALKVALKDDEVVCHGTTLKELSADCASKGVSIRDVAIRFFDTEKHIMVL